MPSRKNTGRRRKSIVSRLLMLPLILVIAFLGWNDLRPILNDETVPTYESYTVSRGDVKTSRSFSATLGVRTSETHSNSRQVTSIRKVFVKANQDVKEGDKLLQLETGEVYKAGIDGTVNEIRFDEGDWIWPNVSLIQICDLTNLQVSLTVDEYDITSVSVGEKCTVTIVPLGLTFETEIDHVDRVSSATGTVAYYSVEAALTVPDHVLPGMTASVSIPSEEALDVVTLEMTALSFDEDKKPYVLVKNGEAYEKRMLETGLSDGMKVQIVSGLSEGDVVYRQTGEEKAVEAVSLVEIYKHFAGETVVVNDRTQSGRGGRDSRQDGMTPPEGAELPEGMTPPEGMQSPGEEAQAPSERPERSGEREQPTGGSGNEKAD